MFLFFGIEPHRFHSWSCNKRLCVKLRVSDKARESLDEKKIFKDLSGLKSIIV